MVFNQKGQEFDVFKLVIAAIVAVAILGVLLTIMGGINPPGGDPSQETGRVLQSVINAPGQPGKTNPVTFKNGMSLTNEAVAQRSGSLGADQVCFSSGDFADQAARFQVTNNFLQYTGSGDFTARVEVLCSAGTSLESWLGTDGGYGLEWDTTYCEECMGSAATCCIIAPVLQNA